MKVFLTIAVLLLKFNLGNGHGVNVWRPSIPPVSHQQQQYGQPVDMMTDVINDLGVKLLDCYIQRPGNVAFSPTGLAFVLTALYEGSAGRTSRQIAHVLGLPRDRRVTEIGLRDIHRRLRSYLNADAFLGGLTLNRDDITLRSQYEDTLRFYGFDVGDMQTNGTTDMGANGTMTDTNTTSPATTQLDSATNGMSTMTPATDMQDTTDSSGATSSVMMVTAPSPVDAPVTDSMDTTTNPAAELINNATDSSGMSANIVNIMNSTATTSSNNTAAPVNATITTTTTTTTPMTSAAGNMESNGMNNPTIVNVMATTSASTVSTSSTLSSTESGNNTAEEIVNATTITPVTAETNNSFMNDSTPTTTNPIMNSTILNSQNANDSSTMIPPVEGVTNTTGTNDDNKLRRKRSHRSPGLSNYLAEGIWIDDSNAWQGYNSPASLDDGVINEDMTDLQFLINGCELSTISTATYTAALPFAYIASLRSYGVEFPLDDPRYNVILLVPSEGTNSRILARLLQGKTLRYIRDSMKPTWVRATIPSFMLRGFITLTPYLQKLGIKDAFEPRAADLSPMSPDLGIYARDIQQSIGVNIRNYLRDGTNESAPAVPNTRAPYQHSGNYLHAREPIPFIVDRPFLFFIVDNETSVALIAGRIDDPLNSRII